MDNIYKIEKFIQPSFFQRILKKEPQENAFIELNNLFATRPLKEIKFEEVEKISSKYKVDMRKKFIVRLRELYLLYLRQCLSDNILTDQELDDLNQLKNLLILKDSEVEELNNQLASEIYKKSYNDAICDGKFEKSEEEFLNKLQNNLRLPHSIVEKISSESRKQFLEIQLGKIIEDGKISPDEWEEYIAIAKKLKC